MGLRQSKRFCISIGWQCDRRTRIGRRRILTTNRICRCKAQKYDDNPATHSVSFKRRVRDPQAVDARFYTFAGANPYFPGISFLLGSLSSSSRSLRDIDHVPIRADRYDYGVGLWPSAFSGYRRGEMQLSAVPLPRH